MTDELLAKVLRETHLVADTYVKTNAQSLNEFGMISSQDEADSFRAGWLVNETVSRGIKLDTVIRIINGVNEGVIDDGRAKT